ncbi:conserved hypothetical protein [Rubrivivax sp. A210]|uniref:hypothetical protein n=1 Tax=Rubrivivax sp. A210 TaxID=2772301 RepID=UPI0019199750|nr:hypothetical protein [Rubrivivax sp. A210]CAD5366622.1 conserved hypothetical protein [Rubrivivax sp. A210]
MSNTYYDQTGVLCLQTITPVIKALFGGLSLDPDYPGNGEVYFRKMAEVDSHTWDDVVDELDDLARSLGIDLESADPDESEEDTLLWKLAAHFGVGEDEVLAALIEASTFEGDADLESLFVIAQAFDDGHGLTAIRFEGCWHCDKPRLFEFGGDGGYIGRSASVQGSSTEFLRLGEEIDAALGKSDVDGAAEVLQRHIAGILAGIDADTTRTALRASMAALLAQPAI